MAFKELVKTTAGKGNPEILASFTIKPSGPGTLRINKHGMNFLATHNVQLQANDRVRVFFDDDTGRIAVCKDPKGPFCFTRQNEGTLRMSFRDLTEKVKATAHYSIECSNEYDLIFVPFKSAQVQTVQPTTKKNKGQESSRSIRMETADMGAVAASL